MSIDVAALEKRADQFRQKYNSGQFDEVIAELTPCLPQLPEGSELRKILSSIHSDRGTARHKQGKFAEARAEFEAAILANPQNWRALVNVSTIYQGDGRYKDAKTALEKAVQINPELRGNAAVQGQLEEIKAMLGLFGG